MGQQYIHHGLSSDGGFHSGHSLWWKVFKVDLSGFTQLVLFLFKFGSLLVSISAFKPSFSLVIDVSMLHILSYNVADFQVVRK